MTQRYFALGPLAGAPHTRYAVLSADCRTVIGTQISRPEGVEVERPTHLRWRQSSTQDVQIKRFRINETPQAGEQPRRTTWRRSGRTAAREMV